MLKRAVWFIYVFNFRLTSTSWLSLPLASGFTLTQNSPTAVDVSLMSYLRTKGSVSGCILSKWWSGMLNHKTALPCFCCSLFKKKERRNTLSMFLPLPPLSLYQGRPHICRQLPYCRTTGNRVCRLQYWRVIRCQCVNNGQWPEGSSWSCGCGTVRITHWTLYADTQVI